MTEPTAEKQPAPVEEPIAEKQPAPKSEPPAKKPSVWPTLSPKPAAPMPYTAVYDWGKVQLLLHQPEVFAKLLIDSINVNNRFAYIVGTEAQLYTLEGLRALYPSFPGEWPPYTPTLPPESRLIQVVNITLFNVAAPIVMPDRRSEMRVTRNDDGEIVGSVTVDTPIQPTEVRQP